MPYLLLLLLLSACVREEPAPRFVDAAASAGIDFVHYNGARGDYYYAETFGSGAAFLDYDGDGCIDIEEGWLSASVYDHIVDSESTISMGTRSMYEETDPHGNLYVVLHPSTDQAAEFAGVEVDDHHLRPRQL